jgi:hypothetical protein
MLLKSSFEAGDELAAKDTTEYGDGQEEGIAGMDPAGMVRGKKVPSGERRSSGRELGFDTWGSVDCDNC